MLEIREVSGAALETVFYWDEANPVSRFLSLTRDEYLTKVNAPNWTHYGIYRKGEWVACASMEAWKVDVMEVHVSCARRAIPPTELRTALRALLRGASQSGVRELFALVPNIHRAGQRLCRDCGLVLAEQIPTEFTINGQPLIYLKYRYGQIEDSPNPLPAAEYLRMANATG